MSVLLPAPFSPQTACSSPGCTSIVTSDRACTPGKALETPRIEMMGGVAVIGGCSRETPLARCF
jgi:hypothetical protein